MKNKKAGREYLMDLVRQSNGLVLVFLLSASPQFRCLVQSVLCDLRASFSLLSTKDDGNISEKSLTGSCEDS